MMDVTFARRIVVFVDTYNMSFERLASQLGCSVEKAKADYEAAQPVIYDADARKAVKWLKEIASHFDMTATELVAAYS